MRGWHKHLNNTQYHWWHFFFCSHFAVLRELPCFKRHLAATPHSPHVFCNPSDYQSIRFPWKKQRGGSLAEAVALATSSVKSAAQSRSKTQPTKPDNWKLADSWQDGAPTCLGPTRQPWGGCCKRSCSFRSVLQTDRSLRLSLGYTFKFVRYGTAWTVRLFLKQWFFLLKVSHFTCSCVFDLPWHQKL